MKEVAVKKHISEQLPNIILIPNPVRAECEEVFKIDIQLDAGPLENLLHQKNRSHCDHQILNGRRQTMAKRETILVVGHLSPPSS